jgi:hypothetical protein
MHNVCGEPPASSRNGSGTAPGNAGAGGPDLR